MYMYVLREPMGLVDASAVVKTDDLDLIPLFHMVAEEPSWFAQVIM